MSDLPSLPDLVGPGLRLLVVGINPSIMSAETGFHFAHPGNRFYPALRAAGILPDHVRTPGDAAPVLAGRAPSSRWSAASPRPGRRASPDLW